MSLDYNLTEVEDREVNFPPEPDGSLNAKMQSAIFYTMSVGINPVTTANVQQFWTRVSLYQTLIGPMFWRHTSETEREAILLTKDDCANLVGLHTNASRKTLTQFLKEVYEMHERVVNR